MRKLDGAWQCPKCEPELHRPGLDERLADGFALMNASEDPEIESDKHI